MFELLVELMVAAPPVLPDEVGTTCELDTIVMSVEPVEPAVGNDVKGGEVLEDDTAEELWMIDVAEELVEGGSTLVDDDAAGLGELDDVNVGIAPDGTSDTVGEDPVRPDKTLESIDRAAVEPLTGIVSDGAAIVDTGALEGA
ncbi:hypothetical protein B0A54_04070 [Friedmanniomyces endolithicus]|uniref:Uncharacterized protein n=1 Tax=Friedmanniomyces endolithicus TaxID=329885 RepID=A0A4U0V9H2_9PEZI|nr:hypothetical protein B0A54_04070 [Friedmanniomyces endolithicus]